MRGWVMGLAWSVGLAAAVAVAAPEPTQSEIDAARSLADAALELYEAGDYAKALQRFKGAEAIIHAPPHRLYIARSLAELGRLVEAKATYLALVEEDLGAAAPKPFRAAQDEGRAELAELAPRIPSVVVRVGGAAEDEVRVVVDGHATSGDAASQPLALDPGEHTIAVQVGDGAERTQTITLQEGERDREVRFDFGSAAAPSDEADTTETPTPLGPLVTIGAGTAVLAVGVVTGVLTLNDAAELKDECPANPCPTEHEPLADSVHTLGTVSTVAFVVGGVALGAGAVWLTVELTGQPDEPAQVSWYAGPGVVGLRGSFR